MTQKGLFKDLQSPDSKNPGYDFTQNNNAVFILPLGERYLIYAPLSGLSALVNRSAVLRLQGLISNGSTQSEPGSELAELARHIQRTTRPRPGNTGQELNPCFLGLIPTRSCTGGCVYCDFEGSNTAPKVMPLNLAAQAVDWFIELNTRLGRESSEIHFFGGEPMLAFEVVQVVVHRARMLAQKNQQTVSFHISTNGQYDRKTAQFLGDYFKSVVLSLDGRQTDQDLHRLLRNGSSSFEGAVQTARSISNSNADLCLRACISNSNVEQMSEIAHWFCTEFQPTKINFETLQPNPATAAVGLIPPDPFVFAQNYCQAKRVINSYGVDVVYAADLTVEPSHTFCPVGQDAAIVSPDGRISNCYLLPEKWQEAGLDLDFGCFEGLKAPEINPTKLDAIRRMVLAKPHCDRCFCRWSCAGGCHVNNRRSETESKLNDFCIQTRIIGVVSLLEKLGLDSDAESFLKDWPALAQLAARTSDLLRDFSDCS